MILLLALFQTEGLQRTEWTVGDVQREAWIAAPTKESEAAPLVFVFHGHGGTGRHAAQTMSIHKHWPEAVVVYPQGLPTPGKFDPDGRKPGWQKAPGDQGDRDLRFFDEMLAAIKKDRKIDESRIYATGHSNGGAFTYLLWSQRADVFAAFAPSAAGGRGLRDLTPRPAMHIAGEKDDVVPFQTQKRVMEAVRQANGCEAEGKEWAKGCLRYASSKDAPFVTFIHPGDHTYPGEAPTLIARFFREHQRVRR
jgi:polyhydroxybutyrate depolymerase